MVLANGDVEWPAGKWPDLAMPGRREGPGTLMSRMKDESLTIKAIAQCDSIPWHLEMNTKPNIISLCCNMLHLSAVAVCTCMH